MPWVRLRNQPDHRSFYLPHVETWSERMPRYHLHLENGLGVIPDVVGQELEHDEAAMAEAGTAAAEVLQDNLQRQPSTVTIVVTVMQGSARRVGTVRVTAHVEKDAS